MSLLQGKVAVVTGGSSGIGRGICQSFAEHGADAVVVADIQAEPKEGGDPTHEMLPAAFETDSTYVECDVSERDDVDAALDAADEYGGIDVMVNNAGIWRPEDPLSVTAAEFQHIIDVNLTGTFYGTQLAAERMVDVDDGGCIVNINSIAGLFGNGNWPSYAASKGGVTTLTQSFAHAFGDRGIRVNGVHPGGIETMIGGDQEMDPEQTEAFLQNVPLGRYGTPADVAGAVTFLASDLAAYVTGESLVVDGGWTNWR